MTEFFLKEDKIADSPYIKRIRRHVTGRVRSYFATTAPGFEAVVRDELTRLLLSGKPEALPGGVSFQGRLVDCHLANLHLRTAGRVLLRVETFKTDRFHQMEARLAAIPWELFLPPNAVPTVSVTAKRSRLLHSDAIAQRTLTAVRNRLAQIAGEARAGEGGEAFPQAIYVRGIDDVFTVSVDSSGENLYKRGLKVQGGPAPLRETIAASALQLAGYDGREPLVDPLCGAGTFSLEAALMAADIPPGMFRTFAFMGWPSFVPKRWEHLKREAAAVRRPITTPLIFASDLRQAACDRLFQTARQSGLSNIIDVVARDFFSFRPDAVTRKKGTVALNPPYGRRLGTVKESDVLFQEICTKLKAEYRGWKLALIVPRKDLIRQVPFSGRIIAFQHGGLRRWLAVGRVN